MGFGTSVLYNRDHAVAADHCRARGGGHGSSCQTHFGPGGHLMACDHAGEIVTTVTSAFEQGAKEA
jgi:hypothetical protein